MANAPRENKGHPAQENGMDKNKLTLEELRSFLPHWLWELKKKAKEEKDRKSGELLVKP